MVMKNKTCNDSGALKWAYCEKCKQDTNHRISKDKKNIIKMDCIYCESLKKKKKYGVAKTKPKGGWAKLKFKLSN